VNCNKGFLLGEEPTLDTLIREEKPNQSCEDAANEAQNNEEKPPRSDGQLTVADTV
jgi:hypothetical protein